MPFTPYHFGPAGFVGMFFLRWINLPAFILINVIIDVEPLVVILNNIRKYPEHGFFHSFAGATVAALLFSLVYNAVKKPINCFMAMIGLKQNISLTSVVFGCILGAWAHVFFDSFLYRDIMPFFPSYINPMYGKITPSDMRMWCVVAAGAAVVAYFIRAIVRRTGKK
jgi:hypothetical protein